MFELITYFDQVKGLDNYMLYVDGERRTPRQMKKRTVLQVMDHYLCQRYKIV